MLPQIKIADYTYALPDERIARFPLAKRDNAKLLVYRGGEIGETVFATLPSLLPQKTLLVFNETKVIPARLLFRKDTGSIIELFCLEPLSPADYEQCFVAAETCDWKCVVGNFKRWKNNIPLKLLFGTHVLQAELLEKQEECVSIRFSWSGGDSFAQVLDKCGATPIPPYLKRNAEESDTTRYQTVYARYRGSVAAPTAGLHFTENVLKEIEKRKIATTNITLHVGAGTFRPVKSETISGHVMHEEPFSVTYETLQTILAHLGNIVAVGTTSTRTLESLYFLGLQCLSGQEPKHVNQWEPYTTTSTMSAEESLGALLNYMKKKNLHSLQATTQVLLAPPYQFKIVGGLVTNFHQPQSTLLLLISAFIGNDNWRKVYDYALCNDFRFLSYGDSSILLP